MVLFNDHDRKRKWRRRRRKMSVVASAGSATLLLQLQLGGQFHAADATATVPLPLTPLHDDGYTMIETNDRTTTMNANVNTNMNTMNTRRRTQQQQQQQTRTNMCKTGPPSLHPGDSIVRGEFLCHGRMRFGIDAATGEFILGFADYNTDNDNGNGNDNGNNNNNNNINNGTGANLEAGNNANTSTTTTTNTASPNHKAWQAIPTSLFIENSRPFAYLFLSDEGNLLGYDMRNVEIYDSNYDYYNRIEKKEDGSILGMSDACSGVTSDIDVDGGGEMCVTLTSPEMSMPGMPWGMVTWGVVVHSDKIEVMEPPPLEDDVVADAAMQSPVEETLVDPITDSVASGAAVPLESVPPPTPRPTRRTRRPTVSPPTSSPSYTPTGNLFSPGASNSNPTTSQSIAYEAITPPTTTQSQTVTYEATSIIWGTVWLDSDTNGHIDQGEDTVEKFEVKLFECTTVSARSNTAVESTMTNPEGMFFFQVPTGGTYRVQFSIDEDVYGYSPQGEDSATNMLGWTGCETSSNGSPIQWNAGLYYIASSESKLDDSGMGYDAGDVSLSDMSFAENMPTMPPTEPISSIGGFIYLDVDENGAMDSKERTAAVGGYTVNDAVIVVSLTDCVSDRVMSTIDVAFPGTYSFGNLTEGLYKLGYEMQVISRSNGVPLYSFIENEGTPTRYETGCGKLGKGEIIDSGNVGLRPQPLEFTSKSAKGSVGPESLAEDIEALSASAEERAAVSTAAMETEDGNEDEGDSSSFVPGLVGALVTLSIIAMIVVVFIKRRREGLDTFPTMRSTTKTERELDMRSVGSSSIQGDSLAVPSANQTAIGSMIAETNKSVAALTAGGSADGSDSDGESDNRSYTGMEFALKSTQDANGSSVESGPHDRRGSGGVFASKSPEKNGNTNIEKLQSMQSEESTEGFVVYDDGNEDEEHGHRDYGPVVSDIIAKYSQKHAGQSSSSDEEAADGANHPQQAQVPTVAYQQAQDTPQHFPQGGNQDWRQYQDRGEYQEPLTGGENQLAIVPSDNQAQGGHYQYENAATEYNQGQGYYPPNSGYDASHQHQHGGPEYDEQTTNSGSSRSSDPPAASYRDIPAANAHAGWGVHEENNEGQHYQQYETSQYAANDGAYAADGAYAGDGTSHDPNYDPNYDPTQYAPTDGNGAYPANYEPNQYAASGDGAYEAGNYDANQYAPTNNNDGAYDANYDVQENQDGSYESGQYMANDEPSQYDMATHDNGEYTENYEAHPPVDSGSSSSDSESSESSEEASASGWSESSPNTGSSAVSGNSFSNNWSRDSTSSAAHRAKARRAQSNPRDDRRMDSWKQHAAIPENSTLEYNAYAMSSSNDEIGGGGRGYGTGGGFAPPSLPPSPTERNDDNKSVLSAESDLSADPPGASYKNLHHQFPPPPRRTTPPRRTSPGTATARRTSPNTGRRTTPPRGTSPLNNAASQRGRSVPPPPPRGYPTPPPR